MNFNLLIVLSSTTLQNNKYRLKEGLKLKNHCIAGCRTILLGLINFLLFQSFAMAQSFLWGARAGDQLRNEAFTVSIENTRVGEIFEGDANIIVAGKFLGNTDFDPGAGEFILENDLNTWDVFVQKLDKDGKLVWARRYGNTVRELEDVIMAIDSQNNIYLTGYFITSTNLSTDPSIDLIFNVTEGFNEMYLLKLNPDGFPVWARTFPVKHSTFVNAIQIDAADNILLAGHFRGIMDFDPLPNNEENSINQLLISPKGRFDAFVLKVNPNGEYVAHYTFGTTTDARADVKGLVTDSNIYITGIFRNSVDFGNGNPEAVITSQAFDDGFIMKLNANMEFQWVRQVSSKGSVDMRRIKINSKGQPIGIISFSESVNLSFPNSEIVVFSPAEEGVSDFLVYQLNPENGNMEWYSHFKGRPGKDQFNNYLNGNKEPTGLSVGPDDNIYVAGYFQLYFDADPGNAILWLGTGAQKESSFLIRLAPNGSHIWSGEIGPRSWVLAHDLYVGNQNKIAIAGTFNGQADFDPSPNVFNMNARSNISDVFTLLFSVDPGQNTSLPENGKYSVINRVYPNPFNDSFIIDFLNPGQKISLQLSDIAGRVIYSEEVPAQDSFQHQIRMSEINQGIYFMAIDSFLGREIVKLVKK